MLIKYQFLWVSTRGGGAISHIASFLGATTNLGLSGFCTYVELLSHRTRSTVQIRGGLVSVVTKER